ncbi:MAG: arginase family protein [Acidobacteriota bacterium]
MENPPAERYFDDQGHVRVALIKMPYSGSRNVPELSGGPDYLEEGGLPELLGSMNVVLRDTANVALTPEQDDDYGEWHRMGMASGNYAGLVADNERNGWLTVGLLSNCTSLLGSLSGLQQSGQGGPRRVAMVFIDSHGDFNTPETTLSGMLGGMPVAVSAGMCLRNLRRETGLDRALPTERIVLGAARDLDPLERELIEDSDIVQLSTDDFRTVSPALRAQMERLSSLVDLIYIHVDMDVLDPAEVPGHPLTVPGGPTSAELAAALTAMFRYPKVAALGIASTPWGPRDPEGISRQAAYNLIAGAVAGVRSRAQ